MYRVLGNIERHKQSATVRSSIIDMHKVNSASVHPLDSIKDALRVCINMHLVLFSRNVNIEARMMLVTL